MKLSVFLSSLILFCLSQVVTFGQDSFVANQEALWHSNNYFESTDTIIYQPVCGPDGKSYINGEEAAAAGLSVWTLGDCCSYEKVSVENVEKAWITQVVINDVEVEMTERSLGYQDQTHQFFDLSTTQRNYLSLVGDSSTDVCGMQWSIWIDFNENRRFEASELVYEGAPRRADVQLELAGKVEGELVTRMRVRWAAENDALKGGNLTMGEVADFSVFFQ